MDNQTHSNIDLDLDALKGAPKMVKLNGEQLEVYPPTLDEILQLQALGTRIMNTPKEEMTNEKSLEAIEQFRTTLTELIPSVAGKRINIQQMLALMKFAAELAIPAEAKELKQRGITLGTSKKKVDSDLSEKLQDSSITTQAIQSTQS